MLSVNFIKDGLSEHFNFTYITAYPCSSKVGGSAYKEGLENTRILDEHFGNPTVRSAQSTWQEPMAKAPVPIHWLAILQGGGIPRGLYTSPHLVDFRERIRINGSPIPKSM